MVWECGTRSEKAEVLGMGTKRNQTWAEPSLLVCRTGYRVDGTVRVGRTWVLRTMAGALCIECVVSQGFPMSLQVGERKSCF